MKILAHAILFTAIGSLSLQPAAADAPFTFDSTPGRLPKTVIPVSYDIAVIPNVGAMSLSGKESVKLRFRAATATLTLNSLNEVLSEVSLDGKPVKSVTSKDQDQLTTITLTQMAPAGVHTLAFAYTGKIETQPHGLFLQHYVTTAGQTAALLSTQMEATDARRLFPCWDEPAFRAVFRLTATVPSEWTSISNMPIASRTIHGTSASVVFQPTPKMSSYLIEFSAGDFKTISADARGTQLRVWTVRDPQQYGAVALANAQMILADYDDYFGIRFPLPKLDSIAIPGGFAGAMENWGAITYNDGILLVSKASTLKDRQQLFSVQAHEMAHQWFGDLVTMGWWDDIWLNESFASWRAAKETDLRNPSWNAWEAEDARKERAMRADARLTSHAIQQHVSDELQAVNSFDPEITYNKGQSVLRMLEAYLQADTFRDGIRAYMKARAYSNANSADLWKALSAASGRDVGEIASGWTDRPGFPLVKVQARCDSAGSRTLSLSQKRFLLRGEHPSAAHWSIPLNIRSTAAGPIQLALMTGDSQELPAGRCDQPLSINANAVGFYRASYDDATLDTITKNFAALANGDRIALLDDQWALVESGDGRLSGYLALMNAMGTDTDARAWDQISSALAIIEYDERGMPGHDAFAAYARSIVKPVADVLGWRARADETPETQNLRRTLIADLGAWGDPGVIAEANRRFAEFVNDRSRISPDDQSMILTIVARGADAATFAQLHAIAREAAEDSEKERFYIALTAARDPQLAAQTARIALSDELPPQAAKLGLTLVAVLAKDHHELAWTTLTQNLDKLMSPFPMQSSIIISQYVPEIFWDSLPVDQLDAWVHAHVPAEMSANVQRGMETARFKLSEKTDLIRQAEAFVKTSAANSAKTPASSHGGT